MSALGPFHTALYQRLSTDAGLLAYKHASMAAAGVPTFDHVPKGTGYPYNAFEGPSERQSLARGFGGDGADLTAQVGTWDGYEGWTRILAVGDLIDAALVEPLDVAGWGLVQAEVANRFPVTQGALRRMVHRIEGTALR